MEYWNGKLGKTKRRARTKNATWQYCSTTNEFVIMKRLIILTTIILLVLNLLLGLIITAYQFTNVYLNSAVILLSGIVLWVVSTTHLKDAFKISLISLFAVVGVIEYIMGFFAPVGWSNNWFAILVITTIALEIIFVLVTNLVTNKNK